jgi:phosphohistidine phosphatase
MKQLILFRHAKAERKAESGDDFDRELTKRGRHDAALMGRVLAEAGYRIDAAVVSAARRTRETWEQAGAAFPKASVAYDRRLYEALPRTLMDAAEAELRRANSVIVVGHNPGVQELAAALLKQGGGSAADIARARGEFPTAAVAAFSVGDDGALSAARLFFPADHGGKAGE